MKSKALILVPAFLICFLISNNPLVAQSKDRNNPTPLLSPEIKGFTSPIGAVYWYKLTAGPGKLVLELKVECGSDYRCGASAQFVLYYRDMQEVMNESLSVSGRYRANRNNVSLTLQSKQDFLLSVTPARMDLGNQPGSYMVRFKGPIDLPPEIK